MSDYETEDSYDSEDDANYDPSLEGVCETDRATWCERYHEELTWLYDRLLIDGRQTFGEAFFQMGNYGTFTHFMYKYTTPS